MEKKEVKILKKRKPGYFLSLILLIGVVASTIGMYFYSISLDVKANAYKNEIEKIENKVKIIEKNENFMSYTLLENNKDTLSLLSEKSRIVDIIRSVDNISENYNLELEGFSYSNGEVTTKVTSKLGGLEAYEKTVNFIKSYREDQEIEVKTPNPESVASKESIEFNLDFISNFSGQDEIKFDVSLTLK